MTPARKIVIWRPSLKDWSAYEAGAAEGFQWPEGIARAAGVLSERDLSALGISGDTVIYME